MSTNEPIETEATLVSSTQFAFKDAPLSNLQKTYGTKPRGASHSKSGVKQNKPGLPIIGWREWVGLPKFSIAQIKVKVDTGARSSSLHAFDLEQFEKDGAPWVRFCVHPDQRSSITSVTAEAPILDFRSVRSSSGVARLRPVIVTEIALLGITWPVELTLANRDEMGFRMLLGRQAFRGRFLVDAGKSYYGGRPPRKRKSSPTVTTPQSNRPSSSKEQT